MATYTITSSETPQVERPAKWHFWQIDFASIGAAETVDIVLMTLPLSTEIHRGYLAVLRAEAGSTTPTMGLRVNNTAVILTSTSLAATGVTTPGSSPNRITANANLESSALPLNITSTRSGSAPSTAPKVIVGALLSRLG